VATRERWSAFSTRFPRGPTMLLLVVLVLALNVPIVFVSKRVSPIDEQYWINHLINGSEFHVVTSGEKVDQEALHELCTRGSQLLEFPPCPKGHIRDGSPWTYKGADIAGHSPFYFFISGPIARVLRATPIDVPPDDSLVTWGRLLGSAWLLLGFYFALRAAELLGLDRRWVVVGLVFMLATPELLHVSTIVNPDQSAFPSGAAVLWAGLSWERSRRRLWLVGLAAFIGAALDQTNSIAVLIVLLYLGFRLLQRRSAPGREDGPSLRDHAWLVVMAVVAVVFSFKGWDKLNHWLHDWDVIKPRGRLRNVSHNPVQALVTREKPTIGKVIEGETITAMTPPWRPDSWIPEIMRTAPFKAFIALAQLAAVAALAVTAFANFLRDRLSALALATLIALLVSPSLIVLNDWREGGTFLRPTARYGLSAMPMLAIFVAYVAQRTKAAGVVLTGLAAGLYVSALGSIIL
jgi:hypothetical protein